MVLLPEGDMAVGAEFSGAGGRRDHGDDECSLNGVGVSDLVSGGAGDHGRERQHRVASCLAWLRALWIAGGAARLAMTIAASNPMAASRVRRFHGNADRTGEDPCYTRSVRVD